MLLTKAYFFIIVESIVGLTLGASACCTVIVAAATETALDDMTAECRDDIDPLKGLLAPL